MMSSMVPLDEGLAAIGFTPSQFLYAFLDGGDVPPVYRHAGQLYLERIDVASWQGQARIKAIADKTRAPGRVIDAEARR